MKTLTISVPKSCQEKWGSFRPTPRGGFCSSCSKEVIDFSSWSDERLVAFFKEGKRTCGKFRPDQLKTYSIASTYHANRIAKAFSVLFLTILILFSHRHSVAQSKGRQRAHTEQLAPRNVEPAAVANSTDSIVVRGVVTDSVDGVPVPGTNVVRKGTNVGTVTDADGRYTITITNPRAHEDLVFSFIGYKLAEFSITHPPRAVVDVKMALDLNVLGEEIVVGGACSVRRFSPRALWWKVKWLFGGR